MEQASRIKNINKMISLPQLRHMVQYGNATPLFRNASSKQGRGPCSEGLTDSWIEEKHETR